jgi:hypothetical protein
MEKFPNNHSVGLSQVANVESDSSKNDFLMMLNEVNSYLAGDFIELDIYSNTVIDFSINRTYKLTLHNNVFINVIGLTAYRESFIIMDPNEFTCLVTGIVKEDLEDTRPYNVTLYKFYSNRPNVIELIEKETNMYGPKPGEYYHTEFLGSEFLT